MKITSFLSLLFISVVVQAEVSDHSTGIFTKQRIVDYDKPHIGALLGINSPDGSYQNSAEVGLNYGFETNTPFSMGAELSTAKNQTNNDFNALQRTKLLVTGSYNFSGAIPLLSTSYLGAGFGPALESTNEDDNLEWILMPYAGFDVPFLLKSNALWSAGLNARYLISSSGQPNSASFLFVAKYWF